MPAQTLVSLVFGLRCPHRAHGYPRLLGHLLRTRRVPRPRRGRRHPVPSGDVDDVVFRHPNALDPRNRQKVSRLTSHRSLACTPTHRRARCRPASAPSPVYPSQGLLPTCLAGLIGRDSHPLDDASVFLEGHRTFLSLRTSLAWSHWDFFPFPGGHYRSDLATYMSCIRHVCFVPLFSERPKENPSWGHSLGRNRCERCGQARPPSTW